MRRPTFESPYASWAHVQPYHLHWNNPDRREVAEVMWKAGTRRSWEPPCSNETEFAEYPITMSQYQGAKNPPKMMSDAELKDYIDKKIEEFRGLKARYPHLDTWLVLHEAGGRDLAEEMLYLPPEKGAYMTTKELSLFRIKYMTEVCKRVKKEFPDILIFADVSNYAEAERAIKLGADIVGPTLYGYTEATKDITGPDFREFARMCRDFSGKAAVVMEGHIYTPEDAMKVLYLGAHSVVVGSAITRPHFITKRFTDLLSGYQNDWRLAERSKH